MKSLIIDKPELLSLRQKHANNLLKVLLVLTWFYLFIPVLTLINWFFAYRFFEQNIILLEGYKEYETTTSVIYLSVISLMIVTIILWVNFNKKYAHKFTKKKLQQTVSTNELSDYFRLDKKNIEEYQQYKNMNVHFDQTGNIIHVTQPDNA